MARRKLDTSKINTRRLELIGKGYLTQQEIRQFVPCGEKKARCIYKEIRAEVEKEGLENCSNIILAKRILKFMGLSAKDIEAAAKLESRGI